MIAASKFPINIAGNALLNRIFKSAAIKVPLHTPVPGRGIETINIRPQNPYFCTLSLLRSERLVSFATIPLNNFVFFK